MSATSLLVSAAPPLNATVTGLLVLVVVMLSVISAAPSAAGTGIELVATIALAEPAPTLMDWMIP